MEKILDRRIIDNEVKYRVKWLNYAGKHNTWEPEANLSSALKVVAKYERGIKRPRPNKAK